METTTTRPTAAPASRDELVQWLRGLPADLRRQTMDDALDQVIALRQVTDATFDYGDLFCDALYTARAERRGEAV